MVTIHKGQEAIFFVLFYFQYLSWENVKFNIPTFRLLKKKFGGPFRTIQNELHFHEF